MLCEVLVHGGGFLEICKCICEKKMIIMIEYARCFKRNTP